MEPIIELTKTELIQIFDTWKDNYLTDPDSYGTCIEFDNYGEVSAEHFIKELEKIQNGS